MIVDSSKLWHSEDMPNVPIEKVKPNPINPRVIKDAKFEKLVDSIRNFPEMVEVREIIVNTEYVILGGNMRFRAMQELGYTEVPVRVVDWPEEKQREFVIKDNIANGDWDWEMLANEWDGEKLQSWGMDEVKFGVDDEDEPGKNTAGQIITCPHCDKDIKISGRTKNVEPA